LEVANTFPNITTNFSFSGWAYSTNVGTAGQRMFCDDVNNTGGYALSIGDPGSRRVRFYSRSSNPVSLDTPVGNIVNNSWHYFTAIADTTGLTKKIYVNGVKVAIGAFVNAWGTENGNCSIAGETAGGETGNRLNGRIDEVHVAKTALSADWILTEYNPNTAIKIHLLLFIALLQNRLDGQEQQIEVGILQEIGLVELFLLQMGM